MAVNCNLQVIDLLELTKFFVILFELFQFPSDYKTLSVLM